VTDPLAPTNGRTSRIAAKSLGLVAALREVALRRRVKAVRSLEDTALERMLTRPDAQ